MRSRVLAATCGAALLATLLVAVAPTPGEAIVNRIQVKTMELGYRVGEGGLRVRLTLANREAVEHEATDPAEVERIVQLAQTFAGGRARMFAEIDQSRLRAIQLAVE